MQVTTVGLDLAKNIFRVHGVTAEGDVVFNRALRRGQMLAFFEKLAPSLVGMEACATGHYWGRELTRLGHQVRLIPPIYVKPYVKRGKSDAADAAAICEAVTRPTMRFVAIKSAEQQALLSLHRARDLIVRQRTQTVNVLRGLLAEFGHVVGRNIEVVALFQAHGIAAERIPLSGAAGGSFTGDVSVPILGIDRRVEAKIRGSGFVQIYRWLAGNYAVIARADRSEPLITLRLADFADLALRADLYRSAQADELGDPDAVLIGNSHERRYRPYHRNRAPRVSRRD